MNLSLHRRLINCISIMLILTMLIGCASAADSTDTSSEAEQDIELIDPVGSALSFVTAQTRELSVVTTYQGVVCPDTYEYSYESDQPFGNFNALPGEPVSEGDTLFYAMVEGLDDSIEDIEDENAVLLQEYNDYVSDYLIDIGKAKKEEFEAASNYQNMLSSAPEEDSPYYAGWAKGAMPLESRVKQTRMAREKMEQAYRERSELFELEYQYNETRISRLVEEKEESGVKSSLDGVVVAANYVMAGDNVPIGTNIVAVGDPANMEIKSEYVGKSTVNKASDIYAIIDGERYEVVYENMEPEEYRRLKQKEDEVYTTFKLSDPEGKVSLGQYAVIVVVESVTPNALCVPKDAVSKDDNGQFVYLYKDGDSVYTPVTTGQSDNAFIQILSGLSEGDKVIYDVPYDIGNKSETLSKGSVCTEFDVDGYLSYPTAEWVVNPAKNGVCYLNELCVDRFEQITEGQTLAKIEVVADTIEIERIQRKIQRQNERIADLNEQKRTTYNKDELETLDRAIRDRNRTIESLNRQLEKIGKYSGVFELKAPYTGIVIDVSDIKAGSIINYKEKLLQIANDDSCYIIVEDKGGILSYGDNALVTCKDSNGNSYDAEGTVVSMNPFGLSKSMRIGYSLVKVSQEDMSAMTGSGGSDNSNGYWYRVRFTVTADARKMDNVILIPKRDVYKTGNDTYVIVKDESGSTRLVKFIAGGSDNANYWVAYGDIEEGMTICSE
ncbi:Multidrug efflux pump subunit AcrA (membrane-fusion protein) [Lachnospiraceae bacterium XBB2008]|nr:Multidrug efflux pump subunit AcrA (membrane-fusion protein) [Lachnospiraceae bacterium XBB2008]